MADPVADPAPAPIIVTATFGPADQARFDALRRAHFPPERNHLSAHLTLFHHIAPSLGYELDRRMAEATRRPPPPARLAGLINLGRGVALRIDSAGLADVRADLAEAFADCLTPQDAAGWRAHVTVQNKVDPAVSRALLTRMQQEFMPSPVAITGLASWWYRGGPWEARSTFRFR